MKEVIPIHGSDHCPGGPDPIPCLTPTVSGIEWVAFTSPTNLGAAWTTLDWTDYTGAYDNVTPTFDDNASGNIEIAKGGVYFMAITVAGLNNDGTGTTVLDAGVQVRRIAGEQPQGSVHGNWTLNAYQWGATLPTFIPVGFGAQWDGRNVHLQNVIGFEADQFTGPFTDGPMEIEVQARYRIDLTETADTTVVCRFYIVRLGDQWVDA